MRKQTTAREMAKRQRQTPAGEIASVIEQGVTDYSQAKFTDAFTKWEKALEKLVAMILASEKNSSQYNKLILVYTIYLNKMHSCCVVHNHYDIALLKTCLKFYMKVLLTPELGCKLQTYNIFNVSVAVLYYRLAGEMASQAKENLDFKKKVAILFREAYRYSRNFTPAILKAAEHIATQKITPYLENEFWIWADTQVLAPIYAAMHSPDKCLIDFVVLNDMVNIISIKHHVFTTNKHAKLLAKQNLAKYRSLLLSVNLQADPLCMERSISTWLDRVKTMRFNRSHALTEKCYFAHHELFCDGIELFQYIAYKKDIDQIPILDFLQNLYKFSYISFNLSTLYHIISFARLYKIDLFANQKLCEYQKISSVVNDFIAIHDDFNDCTEQTGAHEFVRSALSKIETYIADLNGKTKSSYIVRLLLLTYGCLVLVLFGIIWNLSNNLLICQSYA